MKGMIDKSYFEQLTDDLKSYEDLARSIRRELHQIPEIGFEENKTSAYIKAFLEGLGYTPECIAKTGLALFIPGTMDGENRTLALRADMDALEIEEPKTAINQTYRSTHKGFMHACGHDGHMAMLLVLAAYLKHHPEIKHLPLLLVFQPAEEGPGGAEPVVKTGIFQKYNTGGIIAFHLFPFLEEGVISSVAGPMMAMTSEFYITLRGRSAHAGEPENGIDAILAGAAFVSGMQAVLTRNVKRSETTLLNIGTFTGGERMNIVPGEVRISGTMRSYKQSVQELMRSRMREMLAGIDTSYQTQSELRIVDMYPPVDNDEKLFTAVNEALSGEIEPFEKVMLAEDFSQYQRVLPGVFLGLGVRNKDKGHVADLHTQDFSFDERVLLKGVSAYLDILKSSAVQEIINKTTI